jgi:hypothetical protein
MPFSERVPVHSAACCACSCTSSTTAWQACWLSLVDASACPFGQHPASLFCFSFIDYMHAMAIHCGSAAAIFASAGALTLLRARATGQHWSHVHPPSPAALQPPATTTAAAAATPTCSAHMATTATCAGHVSKGINWSSRSHAGNACLKQLRLRCMCCLCA